MGIELAAGRDFRKDQPAEAQRVIINEAAVKAMGWGIPQDADYEPPLGKRLLYLGNQGEPFEVIGILKDFHFWSLHNEIEPLAIFVQEAPIWKMGEIYLSIRLGEGIQSADQLENAISGVEKVWTAMAPGVDFGYSFLDQDFFESFQAEQRLGRVMSIFTFLAIFIACLGLLGLTAFSVEQRRQEIGIRKVLGAHPMQIVALLSRSVIAWIALAFVIATPITIWLVNGWLDTFAYRISIEPTAFIVAGGMTLLVAMVTMSFHAWQATRINPVEALRDE
jgi:putative ABC transport system permease protein